MRHYIESINFVHVNDLMLSKNENLNHDLLFNIRDSRVIKLKRRFKNVSNRFKIMSIEKRNRQAKTQRVFDNFI